MIIDYFKIALRSLSRRRLRAWLTLIGIIIGITSVVALVGLGQGLQAAIANIFGDLGTDKISVTAQGGFGPPGTGVVKPLTTKDLSEIERIRGVDNAVGRLVSPAKIEYNKKVSFGYAVSMPPEKEDLELLEETFNIEAEEGRLLRETDRGKIFLGYNFYDMENYFGRRVEPGSNILIQDKSYEVVGIAKKLGNPIFDSSIYINEDNMRDIFNISKDRIDVIAVKVSNEDEIKSVAEDIEILLRKNREVREGEEDFSVSTPQQALENVNSTLGAVNIFVYVIAAISILVGGIGIMNTMFMSVTERTRDIGIMKSIGATNEAIFSLFFIESGLLGSVGGLIGAILGSLLSIVGAMVLQSFLGGGLEVGAQITPLLFFGSVGGAFIIGSLFGTIPAIKASKLHPVDALRKKK